MRIFYHQQILLNGHTVVMGLRIYLGESVLSASFQLLSESHSASLLSCSVCFLLLAAGRICLRDFFLVQVGPECARALELLP